MSTSRCKTYIYLSIDRLYRTQCNDLYPYRLNPFTLHPCHNPFWLPPCTLLTTYDHLTCHSHHQCPQQPIVTIHCFKSYVLHILLNHICLFSPFHAPSFPLCCSLRIHHFSEVLPLPDIRCVHFGFVACSYCLTLIPSILCACRVTHGPRKFCAVFFWHHSFTPWLS